MWGREKRVGEGGVIEMSIVLFLLYLLDNLHMWMGDTSCGGVVRQKKRVAHPILDKLWANVADSGPALTQNWFHVYNLFARFHLHKDIF